ncbi:hypothetical protein ID866_10982 [Astraeus odoratus]|nr:hypothetical protein ID866_10982 [Astraeus odoratus]
MRAELMQGGNTYVDPNALISISLHGHLHAPYPSPTSVLTFGVHLEHPDLTVYLNSHLCEFTVNMPTHMMQTCLHAHTQTEHRDAEHYLSGSCQTPSVSDHHPPLSACHLSPTTPHQEPCIRTLAKELEDAQFITPDGPGEPNDLDDGNGDDGNNASEPSVEDNPILMLTNAITCLSNATRHRLEDSGAACTKVHEPDTFNGMDLKNLCEFLIQCELNFCDRPQAFCSDMQKVSFALSFLKGIALTWFKPDLLDTIPGTEPTWANNYSEFIIELTTNFGPHDPVNDAEHQLNNLLMKDSSHINKYIVKFNHLATQVHGYREGALCHMLYNGLPDHIKDEIAHIGKPPHLIDLCTMAQGIDARYWECKSEITCQTKSNLLPSSSSKQSSSGGSSSKQSNTSSGTSSLSSTGKGKNPQHPSSSTPKSSDSSVPDLSGIIGKDGKLTAMECLHHMKNLLCLFCGLPGHSAKDYPRSMSCVAKAHTTQAASIAAPTVETPAEVKK